MSDPSTEARNIANRAKLKEMVDLDKADNGRVMRDMLKPMRHKLEHNLRSEMIYDYFFSDDDEVQKTLNKVERFTRGLQELEAIVDTLPKGQSPGQCNHESCNGEHSIDVRVVDLSHIFRRMFDIG